MSKIAEELEKIWHNRLQADHPQLSTNKRKEIIKWLLGENPTRFDSLPPENLAIATQGIEYRYRILRERYLSVSPNQAYRNLINRLGSVVALRNKIRTWVALSRDRQRAINDVLQEVIQEMLHSDRYIQGQMLWIAQCSTDERLRNNLLFAALEEYALRPIRNQPLLAYRFVNFLRRQSKGGMTQVPQQEMIRLLSEEIGLDDSESSVSLLDSQAINQYQDAQAWEEQLVLRQKVQQEFSSYLAENVGQEAVTWLKLYLAGKSQEEIATALNIPIKQVYRLREKISYHAIRVFALKGQPELVANWLEISLQEHNFGLTPKQWESYWQQLTPTQQAMINELKDGKTLEEIARLWQWKKTQVMGEWSKLYLTAQSLRTNNSP